MNFEAKQAIIIRNCYALPSIASAWQDEIRADMERRAYRETPTKASKRNQIIGFLRRVGEAPLKSIAASIGGAPDLVELALLEMERQGEITRFERAHPVIRKDFTYFALTEAPHD